MHYKIEFLSKYPRGTVSELYQDLSKSTNYLLMNIKVEIATISMTVVGYPSKQHYKT